VGIGAGSVS